MVDLLEDPRVGVAVGHQCRYGLVTRGKDGEPSPALKPTQFASSSPQMLSRLNLKCGRSHKHEWLMNGRAAAAAFYPDALVLEILRGVRDTADAEDLNKKHDRPELIAAIQQASALQDQPLPVGVQLEAEELKQRLEHMSFPVKYASGKTVQVTPKFKETYVDE